MNNAACGFVYITPDYRVAWENTAHVLPPEFDDGTRFFEVGEPCYKNEHRMQNSHTRKFVEAAFREKNRAAHRKEDSIADMDRHDGQSGCRR